MAVSFVCGGECRIAIVGATNAPAEPHWDAISGTPAISTTTVRTGSAAIRCNAAGAAVYIQQTIARRVVSGRIYVRWASFPGSTSHFISLIQAGGDGLLRVTSGGQVTIQVVGSAAAVNVGSALSTGTWYRIDFLYDSSGATTTFKARIDGGTEASDSFAQTAADVTNVRFGPQTAVTSDFFFDDLILGDASGDYPFGAGTVEGLSPTSDGTHSFTAGDFGYDTAGGDVATSATDVFGKVDDADLTSTADLIRQKVVRSTGYVEVGGFTPSSGEAPQAITAIISSHSGGTGANTMGWKLNDGGTTANISDNAGDGLSDISNTAIGFIDRTFATRPNGGGAWTNGALTSLKVRGGFSTDVNAVPYWDGVMLEVAFPAPSNQTATPNVASLTTVTFAPVIKHTITGASPTALAITSFAPVIRHQITGATPTALTITTFAPVVTAPALQTPSTAALTITTFAPSVTVATTVTPGAASLTTSTFAPTVIVTAHVTVTPGTASLTTATFAPVLNTTVTPSTASVASTGFAPTVSTPVVTTPDVATFTTTTFAPTVSTPRLVTPDAVAITTSTFAPTVTAPALQTPDTIVLVLTAYAPVVDVADAQDVVVPNAELNITTFAPSVTTSANITVTPDPAAIVTTRYAPALGTTVTPATASLVITPFAPSAGAPVILHPLTTDLVITRYAPDTVVTDNRVVTPDPAVLIASTFAPLVINPQSAMPDVAALVLTTYAPRALTALPLTDDVSAVVIVTPAVTADGAVTPAAGATVGIDGDGWSVIITPEVTAEVEL